MNATIELNIITCAACFVPFGIMDQLERQRREDGKTFHCPNGHENIFRESEVAKLNKQLETVKRDKDAALAREQMERDQRIAAESHRDKIAKAFKKSEQRTKNGVCPCCTRSFVNLQRHISTKHPGFAPK
jgi:Zn-finger protein